MTQRAFDQLCPVVGIKRACELTGRARSGHYRKLKPKLPVLGPPAPRPLPERTLSKEEQHGVLAIMNSGRFCDFAPEQIYATLLDEGLYLCSARTMYRLLNAHGEVKERRKQATHPAKVKPELIAEKPNEIWSWDITKLHGPAKRVYFDLLVALDIFSRYALGWLVVERASSEIAKRWLNELVVRHQIPKGTLTIHQDRGTEMTGKPVVQLLDDLQINRSYSRPRVSNDNPYSEAGFKTLKYHPTFPENFGSAQDARSYCDTFFGFYNHEHRHSGIGFYTPASVHFGTASEIREGRQHTLELAHVAHPERFVRGVPQASNLPEASWINKPEEPTETTETKVSDPMLLAAATT